MSQTVKFTISDENYELLKQRAGAESLSIQDYIRNTLFPGQISITPLGAIKKALETYSPGEIFSVPQIYGDSWNLPNGVAGQFGRKFFALVEKDYNDKIHPTGNLNSAKHTLYEIIQNKE